MASETENSDYEQLQRQVQQLEEKLKENEQALTATQSHKDALIQNKLELERQLDALREAAAHDQQALEAQIQALQKQLQERNQTLAERDAQYEQMQREREQLLTSMEQLKQALQEATDGHDSLQQKIQELLENIESQRDELAHAQSEREQLHRQIEMLEQRVNDMTIGQADAEQRVEALTEQTEALRRAYAKLVEAHNKQQLMLEAKQFAIESLTSTVTQLQQQIEKLQTTGNSTTKQLLQLQEELKEERLKLDQLKEEAAKKETALQAQVDEVTKAKEALEEQLGEAQQGLADAQNKVNDLTTQLEQATGDQEALQKQLDEAKQLVDEKVEALSSAQKELTDTKEALETSQSTIDEFEGQLENAQSAAKDLEEARNAYNEAQTMADQYKDYPAVSEAMKNHSLGEDATKEQYNEATKAIQNAVNEAKEEAIQNAQSQAVRDALRVLQSAQDAAVPYQADEKVKEALDQAASITAESGIQAIHDATTALMEATKEAKAKAEAASKAKAQKALAQAKQLAEAYPDDIDVREALAKAGQLTDDAVADDIYEAADDITIAVKNAAERAAEEAAKQDFAKAQEALNEAKSAAVSYEDEAVKAALSAADALGEEATIEDVVNATKTLNDVMKAADEKAQEQMQSEAKKKAYDALQKSRKIAQAYKDYDFVNEALQANASVNEQSTLDEIRTAQTSIQDAILQAIEDVMNPEVTVQDKEALNEAIQRGEAVDLAGVPSVLLEGLERALTKAKDIASNDEATKEEVRTATKELNQAVDAIDRYNEAKNEAYNEAVQAVKKAEEAKEVGTSTPKIINEAQEKVNALPEETEDDLAKKKELQNRLNYALPEEAPTFTPVKPHSQNEVMLSLEADKTKLPNRSKNAVGLIGADFGIIDLNILDSGKLGKISETNKHKVIVDEGTALDLSVSGKVTTALGGSRIVVGVYKKNARGTFEQVQKVEGTSGSLLGLGNTWTEQLETLRPGEYEIIMFVEEGVTLGSVVNFSLKNQVLKDYRNILKFENSRIKGANVLEGQDLGVGDRAKIHSINVQGASKVYNLADGDALIQGKYGQLTMRADGTYDYTPDANPDVVGKVEVFDFIFENEQNHFRVKGTLTIRLNEQALSVRRN